MSIIRRSGRKVGEQRVGAQEAMLGPTFARSPSRPDPFQAAVDEPRPSGAGAAQI